MVSGLSVPLCFVCAHFLGATDDASWYRCAAFPTGIPEAIIFCTHSHETPFPGDQGIRFARAVFGVSSRPGDVDG